MATVLSFRNHQFNVVTRNNQIWLTSKELARALEMSKDDGVSQIYHRNSDEFSADMTQTLNLSVSGKISGELSRKVRIFSLRGAHLVAMFARTPVAKEFRRWVLDILDREVGEPVPTVNMPRQELPAPDNFITIPYREFIEYTEAANNAYRALDVSMEQLGGKILPLLKGAYETKIYYDVILYFMKYHSWLSTLRWAMLKTAGFPK